MAAKTPESNRIDFVTGAPVRYMPRIERLNAARDRALRALGDADEATLRASENGDWSAARRAGFLIGYADHAYDRIYRMSWLTDPDLPSYDEEAAAEKHAWEARSGERLRDWLMESTSKLVEYLKTLPDSSWGRAGSDPELGRRSIAQEVDAVAEHLEAQAAALEAALRR